MAEELYDFSGYVTRNDLLCSDGRTIRRDAFAHQDGTQVPLVWQHDRGNMNDIIGHVTLENRDDGVYGYGSLNNTELAHTAKELVQHKDITNMSIYANQLKQNGGDVLHGQIREVSLVVAGANPGAVIDVPYIKHSDGSMEELDEEGIIYTPDEFSIELSHADKPKSEAKSDDKGEIMADNNEGKEINVQDVLDSFTEDQKIVIGMMLDADEDNDDEYDDEYDDADESAEHDDYYEGEDVMKHNVFDDDTMSGNFLSHSEQLELEHSILEDAKRNGSLRDTVNDYIDEGYLQHDITNADGSAQTYGIADIDYLFPDAKSLNTPPAFIQRKNDWVAKVINGTHHTPFSRIKSMFANITMDEARAKGYIKGNRKKEEVFTLLKRTTDPQTIYKKQKMDRDDQIDITDFDVISWLKTEMRMMLDEEIARAILIGDGRMTSDEDHISHDHIRPIAFDDDLYTIKCPVETAADADESAKAKAFIRKAIKARKDYRGSGSPTLFTTEDQLADMLLIEDGIGHLLYQSEAALATAMRVSSIVTVPVMEGLKDADGNKVIGIAVNLADYNIGADKGGAVSMFEDFDIDYNQNKYLIETRCSGALTVPYSAMLFTEKAGSAKNTSTTSKTEG